MGVLNTTLARVLSGAALSAVIVAGFTLIPTTARLADADPIIVAPPSGALMSFADLIEQVSPAVVSVYVVAEAKGPATRFPDLPAPFDRFEMPEGDSEEATRPRRSQGSGFFISVDGYIVTNNHVIEGATEIEVQLDDETRLSAEIVGADPETDLAVLKVSEEAEYPYVAFNTSSDIRRGDWAVSVGNPLGLGGTATAGIVSASKRDNVMGSSGTYVDYIQLDAPINKGNSGGPTFDLKGQVIGVNTSIYSPTGGSIGIGFAIQSKQAKLITDLLIRDGKVTRGWLGVSIQNFSEEMAESQGLDARGAIVSDVRSNSPAEKGGFKVGDVILAVNDVKGDDSTQITRLVGALIAGTQNSFDIIRRGKEMQLNITVAERPADLTAATPTAPTKPKAPTESEKAPLGISVKPLDDEAREKLKMDGDAKGLLVTKVEAESPFMDIGLSAGMAILEVNYASVNSVADFTKALKAAKSRGRSNVLFTIRGAQGTAYTAVELEEFEE